MADGNKIAQILLDSNPEPEIELDFTNPLELLIATILSAQCTDKRVNMVTRPLFKKYKSAEDYARAIPETLEEEIRQTGFFKNKTKSIINCCTMILNDFGGEIPQTMEKLVKLPGVGRKTANVILAGAYGKQAIPVDTHVIRLSNRLGLTKSKNPDIIEQDLMAAIPKDSWSRFATALILHGRRVCKARKPLCSECVIYDECDWPEKGN
ncbi:MAG: endonuclease III [Deltaproteobacteria bacterium]|nr:endonuclease III [Deltaproteobacteria bacterium]